MKLTNIHRPDQALVHTVNNDISTVFLGINNMSSSTFHYHSYFKDSISVQKRRRSTNDCEEHESNPHLQDFLVPHHTGDVKSQEIDRSTKRKPTLPRPCVSILHNAD
mmetsp:Transcript_4614/g.7810  ORF Transcript_4614/g.7810 Transcript_4614/m.7810 type:complete len:107 (+) Transcript_4614:48-368(+)